MRISDLLPLEGTIPMGTFTVVVVPQEDGTYVNRKLDMSSLTVEGGGSGGSSGGTGGVTEDRVREIVNEMISGSMESLGVLLSDTLNGNTTT